MAVGVAIWPAPTLAPVNLPRMPTPPTPTSVRCRACHRWTEYDAPCARCGAPDPWGYAPKARARLGWLAAGLGLAAAALAGLAAWG